MRFTSHADTVSSQSCRNHRIFTAVLPQSLFGIHRDNGSIYVAAPLDRETAEEVTLTVFAQDVNAQAPAKQNNTGETRYLVEFG